MRTPIRPFRPGDAAALHAIELRATLLLAGHGFPALADGPDRGADAFADELRGLDILVAETGSGTAAGYAAAVPLPGSLHLVQLSVDPPLGRRGIGSALLESVVRAAAAGGLPAVTLSTFRDVPFNAPFYAARGFVALDPLAAPAPLARRFAAEVPPGIDPATRTLMIRRLSREGTRGGGGAFPR